MLNLLTVVSASLGRYSNVMKRLILIPALTALCLVTAASLAGQAKATDGTSREGSTMLSDLRQVLNRYPAKAPFAVSASVRVNGGSEGSNRAGASRFEAESGPAGFTLRVLPDMLEAAEAEATAKKRDPNSPTPTRTAMVAMSLFDVMDSTDAAAMLLNDLSDATLLDQKSAARNGKAATLLRVKVKPSLATRSRFMNEPKIELRIWVGADGVPIAAERDSDYSASFFFLKGNNVRKESWEYAVRGDRLYAVRNDEINSASAAGKSMVTSRSVSYSPK